MFRWERERERGVYFIDSDIMNNNSLVMYSGEKFYKNINFTSPDIEEVFQKIFYTEASL